MRPARGCLPARPLPKRCRATACRQSGPYVWRGSSLLPRALHPGQSHVKVSSFGHRQTSGIRLCRQLSLAYLPRHPGQSRQGSRLSSSTGSGSVEPVAMLGNWLDVTGPRLTMWFRNKLIPMTMRSAMSHVHTLVVLAVIGACWWVPGHWRSWNGSASLGWVVKT